MYNTGSAFMLNASLSLPLSRSLSLSLFLSSSHPLSLSLSLSRSIFLSSSHPLSLSLSRYLSLSLSLSLSFSRSLSLRCPPSLFLILIFFYSSSSWQTCCGRPRLTTWPASWPFMFCWVSWKMNGRVPPDDAFSAGDYKLTLWALGREGPLVQRVSHTNLRRTSSAQVLHHRPESPFPCGLGS